MLYSAEIRLKAAEKSSVVEVTGYHLYALFLSLIEGANPALAARLHADGGPKAFTISPVAGLFPRGQSTPLGEGGTFRGRITILQEEVFTSLLDAVWRLHPQTTLPLGGARVLCQGLATTPGQSPWAAFTSFSELLEKAEAERKLRLAFLSPTTFRSKGQRNVLFPEPSLVWGSLLARWNAFAPPSLRLSLGEALAALRLAGYRMSSRMLDFGTYQELGFCGQATYEIDSTLPAESVQAFNALADFAFYAGVGAKTTMGLGQARRLDSARPLPHRAGSHLEEGGRPAPGD